MRVVLCVIVALGLLCAVRGAAFAGGTAPSADGVPVYQQAVDDNDDTRVEVQLVVLGIAVGAVFVLGTGVYLLRKRLGLVPPPPEQEEGHH